MRRLEERVICKDAAGNLYEVEVYRTLERLADGTQELGPRDAFIAVVGDVPTRPLKVFDDEDVFETPTGQILRRVKGGELDVKREGGPGVRLRKSHG